MPDLMRFGFALFLSLAVGCVVMSSPRLGLHIGDRVPPMTLTDYQGNSVTLSKYIAGKVALVWFWSIDCALCNNEMLLSWEALSQKYKGKGFVPIAIHEGRLVEDEGRFRKSEHISYPFLVDEYGKVAGYFGVVELPTTYILDEKGIVREKIIGETGIDAFEKLMTRVLYKEGFYDSVF